MSPGRPRDPAREAAIVGAAIELLAELGYEGLSLDAVAARAGSSKNTIYRRWANKHELVVDAVDAHRARLPSEVEPADTLRGDLAARVDLVTARFEGWSGEVLLALIHSRLAHPELLADIVARRPSAAALPVDVVERAVARGELAGPVDPGLFEEIAAPLIADRRVRGQPVDARFRALLVDGLLVPALEYAARLGASTTGGDPGADHISSTAR